MKTDKKHEYNVASSRHVFSVDFAWDSIQLGLVHYKSKEGGRGFYSFLTDKITDESYLLTIPKTYGCSIAFPAFAFSQKNLFHRLYFCF